MDEYSKFSGEWMQVYASEDGIEISVEDGLYTRIIENTFEVRDKNDSVQIKGYFKIYENTSPKAIDWVDTFGQDSGKTFLAIYELSDREFSFCAPNEYMNRPKFFEATQGHTIRKLVKRYKEG